MRLEYMTTLAQPHGRWVRWVCLAVAHVVSWPGLLVILVLLPTILTFGLLAERARRRTLLELAERSPGSTVVMQAGGLGGPAMVVRVGDRPRGSADGRP